MKVITITANPAIDLTVHAPDWQVGLVNRGTHLDKTAGGKGISVAINLADSGVHTTATGWIGLGNIGTFENTFKKHNVIDAFIRIKGETRRCIKIIDENTGETTDINMPGLEIDPTTENKLFDYLDGVVDQETVLIMGGSLPPLIEKTCYAKIVARYREKANFIVVDTSGKALVETMNAKVLPHMIKPNIHELSELCGRKLEKDEDILKEANRFISMGLKLVVISMGEKGAWFVTAKQKVFAPPVKVKVVSTVGAGDAMVAGTVKGLIDGLSLADIAINATAYSAANIQYLGSRLPSKEELAKLRERVQVHVSEQE